MSGGAYDPPPWSAVVGTRLVSKGEGKMPQSESQPFVQRHIYTHARTHACMCMHTPAQSLPRLAPKLPLRSSPGDNCLSGRHSGVLRAPSASIKDSLGVGPRFRNFNVLHVNPSQASCFLSKPGRKVPPQFPHPPRSILLCSCKLGPKIYSNCF